MAGFVIAGWGEHQQVVGQAGEPVGLLQCRAQRGGQLAGIAGAPQGEFEFGGDQAQRGAQFVAGVGGELPFAGQCGVQAGQQRV